MKIKSINLDSILEKELQDDEFKLAFEKHQFYLQVAHLITELRHRNNISQSELAKKAKISQPMIARLEKGDSSRTPTFDTVSKVLKTLGYTMSINIHKEKKTKVA